VGSRVTLAQNKMICPDCRTENMEGTDLCQSCGADLRSLKLPQPDTEFAAHLMHDHLGDLGAKDAISVSPADPVVFAVHIMREKGAECVLACDETGKIVGIMTERDVLLKAAGERADLSALAVRDIMSPDPVILREDDTLAVALHKMSIGGFRHIPFVSEGSSTLLVSIQDVFRHVSAFIPPGG
jgi:CBS domain-containing protein